jgi:hypothetical protein
VSAENLRSNLMLDLVNGLVSLNLNVGLFEPLSAALALTTRTRSGFLFR